MDRLPDGVFSEATRTMTPEGKRLSAPIFGHMADCPTCRESFEKTVLLLVNHQAEVEREAFMKRARGEDGGA